MASLDDDFFELLGLDNLEKLQALSKMSRIRVDRDDPLIPIPSPVRELERETGVTKDQVLPSDNGSAKNVQPTVAQGSKPTIAHKPSRFDPTLSRFTVRSLSSIRAERRAAAKKNDLPTLHVSQERELETKTVVEEIPSSQSTPLVPPPDSSKCSSRLDSHLDHRVDFVDSLNDPIPSLDSVLKEVDPSLVGNDSISTNIVEPSDPLELELKDSLLDFEKHDFDTAEECELPPLDFPNDLVETFSDSYSDYSDDDCLSDIEYVDASLSHSEIVSLGKDGIHVVV